jgi:predicted flap endonuclease-1-like 5' DNA nuclease
MMHSKDPDAPTEEIDLLEPEPSDEPITDTRAVLPRASVPPPPPLAAYRARETPPPKSVRELRDALRGTGRGSAPPPLPSARPSQAPPTPRAYGTPPPLHRWESAPHPSSSAPAPALPAPGFGAFSMESERLRKQLRERDARLSEVEAILDQRAEALIAAQERESGLIMQVAQLERRVRELEAAAHERYEALADAALPPDDLRRIRGIGPGYQRALLALGVKSISTIAAWTEEDIDSVSQQLNITPGRIRRDRWIEQAQALLRTQFSVES